MRLDNYVRAITVALILLLSVQSYALLEQVNANPAPSRHRIERVVPTNTNLAGTLTGLKIVEVSPNGAAAQAGLQCGDVLIAYNNRPITNEQQINTLMRVYQREQNQSGAADIAELAFYRGQDMRVNTVVVPLGRLGIQTREWTRAGALVEEAIVGEDDYVAAERYVDKAAVSGNYTNDQLLHMRILCVNDEKAGETVRRTQIADLYRKYPVEKLRLFANYDLLYNKRYRAAAAMFERYLKINSFDVSTELSLATCYTEIEKYDEAEGVLKKVLERRKTRANALTDFGVSVLSNIQAKIDMGRQEYARAEAHFASVLKETPNDPSSTLAFLYCAARRDAVGETSGELDAAYAMVLALSEDTAELVAFDADVLRAFVLAKQQRISLARKVADKWREFFEANRELSSVWHRFPGGRDVIDTWTALMPQQPIAHLRSDRDGSLRDKRPG